MSHITTAHTSVAHQPSGTHRLTDAEFVTAFESCTLAPDAFRHYEHVRLAWSYLGALALPEATDRMADAICRFALHHTGTAAKYDANLTRAWMRLVAHVREFVARVLHRLQGRQQLSHRSMRHMIHEKYVGSVIEKHMAD